MSTGCSRAADASDRIKTRRPRRPDRSRGLFNAGIHVRAEFVLATAELQPLHALRRWMGIIRFFGRDEMDEGCRAERPGTIVRKLNRWAQETYCPGGTQPVAEKRIRVANCAIGTMATGQFGKSALPTNCRAATVNQTGVAVGSHSK